MYAMIKSLSRACPASVNISFFVPLFAMGISMIGYAQEEAEEAHTWISENNHFRGSYTSEALEINRLYSWVVHVEDSDGTPVENALLEVDGGMPAHNHGLPTEPKMTEYLGGGDYRIEGLRFHMMGEWELRLQITDGNVTDTVLISLRL